MNKSIRYILALLTLSVSFQYACSGDKQPAPSEKTETTATSYSPLNEADAALVKQANQLFGVLPETASNPDNVLSDEKIKLGKLLYNDPRLSKSSWISCNSCHNLATYGVDNLPTSLGHKWNTGERNAPTSFNAAIHFAQFWDGRAADVEAQAKGPVLNPIEMGTPHEAFAVERIASIADYVSLFNAAFPGEPNPVTYNNITKAIGAFERTLLTPSRFDEFMKGNGEALNAQEKKGLQTFINTGCITCHMGPALGGKMYQKFGVKKDYWLLTKSKKHDEGLYAETKKPEDKYFFKVPSLRNIDRTYPYFHDGSVWSLADAVKIMGELQLDKKYTDEEVADIIAFLQTLTGDLPATAKEVLTLPVSSDKTSKPDFN